MKKGSIHLHHLSDPRFYPQQAWKGLEYIMVIHSIDHGHIYKTKPTDSQFRPGQVLRGRVLKLYPGQKAQIQLGTNRFIAKLEAPLSLGASYHFQVDKVTDSVYLRVLGEQLKTSGDVNTYQLLNQLGIKPSKSAASFVQFLIKKQIPFNRTQLMQAIHFLQHADKKMGVQYVLSEMIKRRLPMTNAVFQALTHVRHHRVGEQMSQLAQLLENENKDSLMHTMLRKFTGQTADNKMDIFMIHRKHPILFFLLKASSMIPDSLDYPSWKSDWQRFFSGDAQKVPYQIDFKHLMQVLEKLGHNKDVLHNSAKQLLLQWGDRLEQSISSNKPLPLKQVQQINQQMIRFLNRLGINKQPFQLTNTHGSKEVLHFIQTFTDKQTYNDARQLLYLLRSNHGQVDFHPKEQLLIQIRHTLSSLGLSYEHDLLNEKYNQLTLKELLLSFLPDKDGPVKKQALQLLHLLNGLQIESVEETAYFLRANLYIPGEKLRLNSDLKLEFEGRKTKSGEINPDYCRILFYLTLTNLGETVVDMNVQNRNVQVTVYNDKKINNDIVERLKPLLKRGLAETDYYLSGVAFKPWIEHENLVRSNVISHTPDGSQGVDLRI